MRLVLSSTFALAIVQSCTAFVPKRLPARATTGTSSVASSLPSTTTTTSNEQSQQPVESTADSSEKEDEEKKKKVVIIGAGWGGLSAAHALSSQTEEQLHITVVDAAPRAGGLVRDGFTTMSGKRRAEAGQHGFWDNYHNIFQLLNDLPNIDIDDALTGYAEQGQYSPEGLEAVWPIYHQNQRLPTGLAQALYTRFENLPVFDRATAAPLVLAFSEFDDSPEAWERYDDISFKDLCVKLGVSRRCYEEAFEPMILTGLFAPGAECSAAAALGMAYFFVLKSQNSFDVRWCKGNIGDKIFQPWVEYMESEEAKQQVKFMTSTRVTGFETKDDTDEICGIICSCEGGEDTLLETDEVIFAVGGAALNGMVRNSAVLSRKPEFRRYANLRGTGVLATRLYLDRTINTPYSANACFGFDKGVGMTFFDITKLHEDTDAEGSVIETDFYHAASLLVMDDEAIVEKVKKDLDTILGTQCKEASVVDAAIVRLPQAVNWYSPGSYRNMPDVQSEAFDNAYYTGDIVRTRHGSWSQEKAYVTGVEAANAILGKKVDEGVIPLSPDEPHVAAGRVAVSTFKKLAGFGDASKAPSLVDFLW